MYMYIIVSVYVHYIIYIYMWNIVKQIVSIYTSINYLADAIRMFTMVPGTIGMECKTRS